MPFFPLLSMFVNMYLILALGYMTWLRFGAWLLVGEIYRIYINIYQCKLIDLYLFNEGFFMYFGYGIRHSKERIRNERQNSWFPCIESRRPRHRVNEMRNEEIDVRF